MVAFAHVAAGWQGKVMAAVGALVTATAVVQAKLEVTHSELSSVNRNNQSLIDQGKINSFP